MANVSKSRQRTVAFFGVLGYLSLVLQWLWSVIIFLPLLLQSKNIKNLFLPDQTVQHTQSASTLGGPAILWTIIGVIVTVIIVGVSLIILVRLPMKIAQSGKKVTRETAKAVLPVVTHHKALPPAKQKRLTARLVKYVKFAAVLLPLVFLVGIFFVNAPLPREVILFVGCFLAVGSLVWFSIEYLLARWFKLPADKIL